MKKIITLLSLSLVLSLLLCGCKDNKEILDNEENESLIEPDEDDMDKKWHKVVYYHAYVQADENCDKCGEYKFNIVIKIDTVIKSDAGHERYKDEEKILNVCNNSECENYYENAIKDKNEDYKKTVRDAVNKRY